MRTSLPIVAVVLAGALLAWIGAAPEASGPPQAGTLPAPGELNPFILDVLSTYPTDGSHGYWWPKSGTWAGNARTLHHAGEVLLEGDPDGRCFCCGLTFEVFLQAWEAWCKRNQRPYRIKDYTKADVLKLKDDWFGADGNRTTILAAVTSRELGSRVEPWEDARPGDFVQLWRHSGSGHSVVFRSWKTQGTKIVGLTYWSVQKSTDGIGERTEYFGDDGSTVKRDEFYIVRIGTARVGG